MGKCTECPDTITLTEAYEGSLECKKQIQNGLCKRFPTPQNFTKEFCSFRKADGTCMCVTASSFGKRCHLLEPK